MIAVQNTNKQSQTINVTGELASAGERLESSLAGWKYTLIPLSRGLACQMVRKLVPAGPVAVCDVYVEGIENGGIAQPWGYEKGGIINIDHHAPDERMARPISSGNLAGLYVKANGPLPGDIPLIISHTDCDSIIASLVLRGCLPVHRFFEAAVIDADHSGGANPLAFLLQSLEDSRDPLLCAKEAAALLKGEAPSEAAIPFIRARERERELALKARATGAYQDHGKVVLVFPEARVNSDLLIPLFPHAALIISASRMGANARGQDLWETKLRLGATAPEGLTLNKLRAQEFDSKFGGRWNAGSTSRSGGTDKTPQEYCKYYQAALRDFFAQL